MKYVSTRGSAPVLGFKDVLLSGLARDGGLYIPENWPELSENEISTMAGKPYAEVAKMVLYPFVEGEIDRQAFEQMVDDAYASFHHPAVAPMVQLNDNHWLLELFHGPTLAFKDVAMQLLARLMDHVLAERGQRATIIGATSGDTGSAAIEAFKGRDNTDIFILFPKGKVSPVQQRQMTTVTDANVHCLAIEGDFDACQAIVKDMFNNLEFRDRLQLSGVNSINWARIMAQIVYYFTAAASIGSPQRKVSFTVPTGNFGDIFAGYVAKRMGLPVDRLVIATNRNDILTRTLATSRYEKAETAPTISPSMDIQVSSNFERLLFDAGDRDATEVQNQMNSLKQSGSFSINEKTMNNILAEFSAGACDEDSTKDQINATLDDCGYLCDPHTAVGIHVAEQHCAEDVPMITLATAHPAKFPAAVEDASGRLPELPARMGDMMSRSERYEILANDVSVVEAFIERHSRAATNS
ncbi:MAG: threonine synthase [Rhizobiaceae bacterium]|nr:threonine synthase [Rhizobiaceae bacterium]